MSLNCSRKALCDAFTWKSGNKHERTLTIGTKFQKNKEFNSYHLKHFQLIRWRSQTLTCSTISMLSKCEVPKMVKSPNIAKRPKSVINKCNCWPAIQTYRIRFECGHTFVHLLWHRSLWKVKSKLLKSKKQSKLIGRTNLNNECMSDTYWTECRTKRLKSFANWRYLYRRERKEAWIKNSAVQSLSVNILFIGISSQSFAQQFH